MIARLSPRKVPRRPDGSDLETAAAVMRHVRRNVGLCSRAFRVPATDPAHPSVLGVLPSAETPWYTLVTVGMSSFTARRPPGPEGRLHRSELFLCLPPDWPLEPGAGSPALWPVRLLFAIARYVRDSGRSLCWGDTWRVQPPAPFSEEVAFDAVAFFASGLYGPRFDRLTVRPGQEIHLLGVLPIYPEEYELAVERGTRELGRRLAGVGTSELLDVDRPSAAAT